MSDLPRIVLPEHGWLRDSFIQVYLGRDPTKREPFFRFSRGNIFHGDILRSLLEEAGITDFETFPDNKYGLEFPVAKGEYHEMVGAGDVTTYRLVRNERVRTNREFILDGRSAIYKLAPNQRHLDDLAPYIPNGFKFTISQDGRR